ncbi:uncharacterized protein K452DRAFT_231454 [Aplosporella prunicola CBS 121167]|uniref:Major facilitator superfamily (MFS) profile domain-containing protein n=1 Tax=Aplosporella prunicola CBS 121167 TaxID=1176127 RepID=A0A6A6B9D2_9PEZI|nr:uncharacterized protein K452DRAFT_231454 [Aplosporella prunicola CBS 121167]KAF2139925.1 hypothetical protein K452DRAFT_231454 [Aplosporella prunicola CBS 121167]
MKSKQKLLLSLVPHSWIYLRRLCVIILIAGIGFVGQCSFEYSFRGAPGGTGESDVSEVAESLAIRHLLVGFGVAFFAELFSEILGRNPMCISTLILYMVLVAASGPAYDIGAQLAFHFFFDPLCRYMPGNPLTCAGGSLSDPWNPIERVYALSVFASCVH